MSTDRPRRLHANSRCAICRSTTSRRPGEATQYLAATLASLGYAAHETAAHPSCIIRETARLEALAKRKSLPADSPFAILSSLRSPSNAR